MPRTSRGKFNFQFQDALNVKNVCKKTIRILNVEEEEKGGGRKKIRAGGSVRALKSFDLRIRILKLHSSCGLANQNDYLHKRLWSFWPSHYHGRRAHSSVTALLGCLSGRWRCAVLKHSQRLGCCLDEAKCLLDMGLVRMCHRAEPAPAVQQSLLWIKSTLYELSFGTMVTNAAAYRTISSSLSFSHG